MTENPAAAVPSEPTTPALEEEIHAAIRLGLNTTGVDVERRIALAARNVLQILARVEVGPSPEQIDAAANAVREWTDDVATDDEPRLHQIMRAALVAAYSVRGREDTK